MLLEKVVEIFFLKIIQKIKKINVWMIQKDWLKY